MKLPHKLSGEPLRLSAHDAELKRTLSSLTDAEGPSMPELQRMRERLMPVFAAPAAQHRALLRFGRGMSVRVLAGILVVAGGLGVMRAVQPRAGVRIGVMDAPPREVARQAAAEPVHEDAAPPEHVESVSEPDSVAHVATRRPSAKLQRTRVGAPSAHAKPAAAERERSGEPRVQSREAVVAIRPALAAESGEVVVAPSAAAAAVNGEAVVAPSAAAAAVSGEVEAAPNPGAAAVGGRRLEASGAGGSSARSVTGQKSRDEPTRAASAAPQLDEAALLARARQLARSDPAASLRVLDEHKRRFAAGMLSPEREVFAIELLRSLSRDQEAENRLQAFRRTHPGSVYLKRLGR